MMILSSINVLMASWRNGSASDSRSEGWVFESLRGQLILLVWNEYVIHQFGRKVVSSDEKKLIIY